MINGGVALAGAAARVEVVRVVVKKEKVIDAGCHCGLFLLMTRAGFVPRVLLKQGRREEEKSVVPCFDILKFASCRVLHGSKSKTRRPLGSRER